uniref:Retinoblastoma-like protein 1 n=1 Tax=Trichogramma kaykai TaxID=54128 RepID=A0ABD2XMW5_9HYME
MGKPDDNEDSTFTKHQDLCEKLNMDASAAKEAWESYENIRQHYTLGGDQLHWIGCALYVACRKASTPTVGKAGSNIQGNCVSLTRLLRLCNLPLTEFFTKSKAWADMCHMPQDFGARIDSLQKNFSVSSVIFQKYQPIFKNIFKDPSEELGKPVRSRRHRTLPCTPSRLFEFGWSLFICIKSKLAMISDDLVNSYHLLLVCCDLLYMNALVANRRDLLNSEFEGLPEKFNTPDFTLTESAICIIDLLCDNQQFSTEAKLIKTYYFKLQMNELFNQKVLRGNQTDFTGLLDALNFDGNNKSVNRIYEQHILNVGDLDERIFLAEWRRARIEGNSQKEIFHGDVAWCALLKGPDSNSNIGSTPAKMMNMSDFQEQFQSKKEQLNSLQTWAPPTPLTGRKYLKTKDIANTALPNPTQSVVRLQSLLVGCNPLPSESLQEIFKNSSPDIEIFVKAKVEEFGNMFCEAYSSKLPEQAENTCSDFGKNRLQSAQILFYKVLELVLNDEMSKKQTSDVSNLLKNEIFLQCLFACCCEIVIHSYQNRDKTFPWILKALNLEAYLFYKVIEVIVKAVDQLTRDMVKHLNRIEEMILESLAWKTPSPLWAAIDALKSKEKGTSKDDDFIGLPSYEEVALPGTFDLIDPNTPGQPVLRRIALDRGAPNDVTQSPISSASDRFQSPTHPSALVKKRLFSEKTANQSLLKGSGPLARVANSEPQRNGPVTSTPVLNRDQTKPRRTGSLALFFRKFYNLTNARMQTLCNALEITDVDVKRKIWTIFEHTIKERTELMKDRHLDQILMSAVYVICKLCKIDKNTFTEIMRCYRLQPQAESHIYRSVLITRVSRNSSSTSDETLNNKHQENSGPPTPSEMAATSRIYNSEERGDLIKFYNAVFVPEVKDYVKRLGLADPNIANLTLSPLPRQNRPIPQSSPVRRVTDCIITRVLDPKELPASPAPTLNYCFNRSPAKNFKLSFKDLETINKMVTQADARKYIGKRLLTDDAETNLIADGEPNSKKSAPSATFVARKLENIMGERRTQNH